MENLDKPNIIKISQELLDLSKKFENLKNLLEEAITPIDDASYQILKSCTKEYLIAKLGVTEVARDNYSNELKKVKKDFNEKLAQTVKELSDTKKELEKYQNLYTRYTTQANNELEELESLRQFYKEHTTEEYRERSSVVAGMRKLFYDSVSRNDSDKTETSIGFKSLDSISCTPSKVITYTEALNDRERLIKLLQEQEEELKKLRDFHASAFVEHLSSEVKRVEKAKNSLADERDSISKDRDDMKTYLNSLQVELKATDERVENLIVQYNKLAESKNQSDDLIVKQRQTIIDLNNQITKNNEEINNLSAKVANMVEEREDKTIKSSFAFKTHGVEYNSILVDKPLLNESYYDIEKDERYIKLQERVKAQHVELNKLYRERKNGYPLLVETNIQLKHGVQQLNKELKLTKAKLNDCKDRVKELGNEEYKMAQLKKESLAQSLNREVKDKISAKTPPLPNPKSDKLPPDASEFRKRIYMSDKQVSDEMAKLKELDKLNKKFKEAVEFQDEVNSLLEPLNHNVKSLIKDYDRLIIEAKINDIMFENLNRELRNLKRSESESRENFIKLTNAYNDLLNSNKEVVYWQEKFRKLREDALRIMNTNQHNHQALIYVIDRLLDE